jgi:DNA-binding transcriptional MerR regulator
MEIDISKAAVLAKVKPHTLRYYENIGLIKKIKRNSSGQRVYSEADMRWLEFINRLRATGMTISKMKEYARLRAIGDETIRERKSILEEHLVQIDDKLEELMKIRNYVSSKIDIYNELEDKVNAGRKQV